MASYVEKYQYKEPSAIKVDYDGLLKGVAIKEAYWKSGVQRIKNAYEQASGLSLTGLSYQEKLNNFMSSADEQLKKALASDTSSYDNTAKAISIYNPLYKDQEIMSNHKITEKYNKTLEDIQSYRKKENGKYYSDTNANYAYSGYSEFKNKMDKGESALEYESNNKIKDYIPYYDYTKDLNESIKNCPEQKQIASQINNKNQAYIDNSTITFKSVSGLRNCIAMGLNEKARTQMMIEASVLFKGREKDLAETYLTYHNEETIGANNSKLVLLDLEISKTKDPNIKQQLENQKAILKSENEEVQKYIEMYRSGDLSFVTGDNFERIATAAYSSDKILKMAQANAVSSVDSDVSANPIFLQAKEAENRENLKKLEFAIQSKLNTQIYLQNKELEKLKSSLNNKGGSSSQAELEKEYYESIKKGETNVVQVDENGVYSYKSEEQINSEKSTTTLDPSTTTVLNAITNSKTIISDLEGEYNQLVRNHLANYPAAIPHLGKNPDYKIMLAYANTVINSYKDSKDLGQLRLVDDAIKLRSDLIRINSTKTSEQSYLNGLTKDKDGKSLVDLQDFKVSDLSETPDNQGLYTLSSYSPDSNFITFNKPVDIKMTQDQILKFYNHQKVTLPNGNTYELSNTDTKDLFDAYINMYVTDSGGIKKEMKLQLGPSSKYNNSGSALRSQKIYEKNDKKASELLNINKASIQNITKGYSYTNLSSIQKNQVDAPITEAYANLSESDKKTYPSLKSFQEAITVNSNFRTGHAEINFPIEPSISNLKYGNDLIGKKFKMKSNVFYDQVAELNYDFSTQIKNQLGYISNDKPQITLHRNGFIIIGTPTGSNAPGPNGDGYSYMIYEDDGSEDISKMKIKSGINRLGYAEMKSRVLNLK